MPAMLVLTLDSSKPFSRTYYVRMLITFPRFLISTLEFPRELVSHLYFFVTLNKERNSPYLQLSRRLNDKMLVLGFLYSKSTPIVQQKNAKKPTCQTIAFFAKY